jgi:hypothetical protein
LFSAVFSFQWLLAHDVAVAKPVRSFHVIGHIDPVQEFIMKHLIGSALVAGALAFAGPAAIHQAAAATPQAQAQSSATKAATDFSARRTYRRHYRHYGYRPYYQPYYYARPYYYRPYPYYAPAPFPFGLGFGPFW